MNDELEKMKLHSPDWANENIRKLAEIFPNCVTETLDADGTIKRAIDYDQLRQELSDHIVDGPQERYHLNWPGKREALLAANAPIAKTLRPARDESVDFDTTQNLFIEGDNLEALKLLQETYLGKVKMIYIDPPYNTGNDFIYADDFAESADAFLERSNQKDENGNRLVANPDSKGRFHSDWLSMMYSRLKLAKNLLADDGVIFISMDDNEAYNLGKLCDEIFGVENFIGEIIRKTKSTTNDSKSGFNLQHEICHIYSKDKANVFLRGEEKEFSNYKNPDNDPNGIWTSSDPSARTGNTKFPIKNPITGNIDYPPEGRCWAFSEASFHEYVKNGKIKFKKEVKHNERGFIFKRYKSEVKNNFNTFDSLFATSNIFMNQAATKELLSIFEDKTVDYPKPLNFVKNIVKSSTLNDDIILDFFAGSSTTAHAVMQLNAEDGGNRKFIMVQLLEECDPKSEAAKAGYSNIAEISKERIRRAGAKILEGECHKDWNKDIGFRVLKVDTSNMKDVYYQPDEVDQSDLLSSVDNIKDSRTGEDLLFQVLVDWGVDLTLPIRHEKVDGKSVYFVDDDALIACFETGINIDFVKQLAAHKPLRVVFRDNGFASDDVKANVAQIFRQTSPDTDIKVI